MSQSPDTRHRPQKKWGQNFLRNPGAVNRIIEAVSKCDGVEILEIGPGEGVLTRELVKLGRRVTAIEIDTSLIERLRQAVPDASLEIVNADATTVPLPAEPFCAVGNLPYNVATPIIRRVISAEGCRLGVFMVQKEVADRMVAQAGDDAYGFLTLFVQMFATARILLVLEPGSFHPRPKVRSAVIILTPARPDLATNRDELVTLISRSFQMRRKNLLNNLTGYKGLGRTEVAELIEEASLLATGRAEEMSLQQFDRLAELIERRAGAPAR
ncbi:MAG TPA: 16S rRNA (adenine(1518)-N(6)/adenine(1519)-N(6))-dimethyltransferase RsmA [Thermoanaerobaculia bacterium]|nr:16S rRNA (adenine(1518)-N(6)/adenine(1519)-N(6))-dimethyltransferase RsmA [Thermoanaerobaculia bacterium]